MKVIGLTGGVGSGKSTVIDILKNEYCATVLIADQIGHKAMQPGTESFHQIKEIFGDKMIDENGEIKRDILASIVFSDEKKLLQLNEIIHPFVWNYISNEIKKVEDNAVVVIESAILVEAGYAEICDEIWYVYATEEVRGERLRNSRGYSEEKIQSVMKKQASEETYRINSTHMISNNGDINEVRNQIRKLLA